MEQMRIMIAMPDNHPFVYKEVFGNVTQILTNFYQWKMKTGSPHELSIVCKGSVCLDQARNNLVRIMLENDMTHIFFMDTDQLFLPETVRLMIECFEGNPEVDAVTGIYTWKQPPFTPHLYGDFNEETGEFYGAGAFTLSELFEVQAAGTGILMIKREVFEKNPYPWFKFDFNSDGSFKYGEDLYFFKHCRPLTICDPRNRSTHLKLEDYGIDDYIDSNGLKRVMKDVDGVMRESFEVTEDQMKDIVATHVKNRNIYKKK